LLNWWKLADTPNLGVDVNKQRGQGLSSFTRKSDFWAGLALAALGAYIVSKAARWSYMAEDGPGAGFFPLWYGGAMVVISLLLVLGTVLKHDPAAKVKQLQWAEMRRAMTCWLALAVCVASLKYVGFVVAFASLTWFIIAVMFRRPKVMALCFAIGGALGFYAIFSWGLDLQLPAGLWLNK